MPSIVSKTRQKRKSRPVGRPTLLDPTLTKRFCDFLRAGATEKNAAQACGWSYGTFMEWVSRGLGVDPDRPSTPELAEFAAAVKEARGSALVLTEAQVRKQHPLAYLYNRDPEQWRPVGTSATRTDEDSTSIAIARAYLDGITGTNGNGKH